MINIFFSLLKMASFFCALKCRKELIPPEERHLCLVQGMDASARDQAAAVVAMRGWRAMVARLWRRRSAVYDPAPIAGRTGPKPGY
ncbi:hypothetical protein [Paracoccus fontiphilus]|uniref:Transposase n=1 Tax=Paracoccus fontiphilus TaxID=1815556 RepID=A0ABV7INB2_9RHOB|nr:hypothetical protein [Paracoccus fontiphilus]